jgi:hypothetical protein
VILAAVGLSKELGLWLWAVLVLGVVGAIAGLLGLGLDLWRAWRPIPSKEPHIFSGPTEPTDAKEGDIWFATSLPRPPAALPSAPAPAVGLHGDLTATLNLGPLSKGQALVRTLETAGFDNRDAVMAQAHQWIADRYAALVAQGESGKAEMFRQATADYDILSSDGRARFMALHRDEAAGRLRAHLARFDGKARLNATDDPSAEEISTDANRALVVTLLGDQWSSFQHKARFLQIQYQVRNRTNSPIQIENFKLEITGMHFGLDRDISAERERLKRDHPPPPRIVPANGTVEGWHVVELEYGPGTGEPAYKLTVHSANGGHEYGFRRLGNPKREITP